MKKLMSLLLALVCFFSLTGCSRQENIENELQRVYVYTASDDVVKPSVMLLEDNRFQFTFSAWSSYFGAGTYTINDDILVLSTDDGNYKYTFRIEGENMDRLIFDAEKSSETIHYGKFEDGAVFE